MEQAEIDRLLELVENCRVAQENLVAAQRKRAEAPPVPRTSNNYIALSQASWLLTCAIEEAQTPYNLAMCLLGAEWLALSQALEELRERYTAASAPLKHRPMPASSVRLSHRDLTGDQE